MKKSLYLFYFVLLLLFVPSCMHAQQNGDESYKQGIRKMSVENYKDAIQCFQLSKIMDKSPGNIAKCDIKIRECENLIKNPRPKPKPTPLTTFDKGLRAKKAKDYRGAIALFEKSMNEDKSKSNIKRCLKNIDDCESIINLKDISSHFSLNAGEKITTIFSLDNKVEAIEWDEEETLQKPIPFDGNWNIDKIENTSKTKWIRAERALSEDGKISYINITCLANETEKKRTARIWLKGTNMLDYFDVIQFGNDIEEDDPYYPQNPKMMSFTIGADGERKIINLPNTTKVIIPRNVNWCQQSLQKFKKDTFFSKLRAKLFGGSPKLIPCDPNEIVIEVLPNPGNERFTRLPIEGSNIVIEIKQKRK